MLHLVQEPPIDLGDIVDDLVVDAALQRLVHAEHALGAVSYTHLFSCNSRKVVKFIALPE